MNTRNLAIVFGILAIIAAILFISDRSGTSAADPDPRIGSVLVDPDVLKDVRSIQVLEDDKVKFTISVGPDGHWIFPEEKGLPVNFQSLSHLTRRLSTVKVSRFVTRREDRLQRLDPRKSGLLFFTGTDESDPALSLHFGKLSDRGGMYVQFNEDPAAYLAAASISLPPRADSWIDKTLLPFDVQDVIALGVQRDTAAMKFRRETPDSPFTLIGELDSEQQVNQQALTDWLNSLANMRFIKHTEATSEEPTEARSYTKTYSLELEDGSVWQITMGQRPEQTIEPEMAGDADAAEDTSEDPATIPAGKPFVFIEPPEHYSSTVPYSELAFEITSYSFNRQPADSDWLENVEESKDSPEIE